jgi:hypothetical protein
MRCMVCEFNERTISNLPVKRSVVGSGPIRCPGKSRPSRYRMKEVFPTEYCPIKRTCGLAKKRIDREMQSINVKLSNDLHLFDGI